MKALLLSGLFGIITHYAVQHQGHENPNPNEQSGALTLHYGNNADFKAATDAFLGHALAFIQQSHVIAPTTQPTDTVPEPAQPAPDIEESPEVGIEVLPPEV